jgi:hypothetical protein
LALLLAEKGGAGVADARSMEELAEVARSLADAASEVKKQPLEEAVSVEEEIAGLGAPKEQ